MTHLSSVWPSFSTVPERPIPRSKPRSGGGYGSRPLPEPVFIHPVQAKKSPVRTRRGYGDATPPGLAPHCLSDTPRQHTRFVELKPTPWFEEQGEGKILTASNFGFNCSPHQIARYRHDLPEMEYDIDIVPSPKAPLAMSSHRTPDLSTGIAGGRCRR